MKKLTFAQYIIDMLAERYRLNAENPVKNYEAVTESADILHDFEEVGKTFTNVPTWCGIVKQLETAVNAPLDSLVLGSVLYEFGLVSPDLNIDSRYVGYNRECVVKWRYNPANKFSLVMTRLMCIRKELDNCLYRLENAVKDFSDDAGNILDEKERRFDRISAPLLSALYGGFEDIQELLTRSEDTESEEAKALQSRLETVRVSAEKWLATHPEKFPEPEKTTIPFEEERRRLEYNGTFCTVSRYENGKYTREERKERSVRTYSALIKYFYNKIVSARETLLTVDSETGLSSAVSTLKTAYKAIKALQGVTAEKYHVFKAKKPDVKVVSAPVQRFEVGKLYQITKTGAVEIVEISGSSAKITWAKIKPECKAVKIAVVDGVEVFNFGRWTVKANKEFTAPEPQPTTQEEENTMNETKKYYSVTWNSPEYGDVYSCNIAKAFSAEDVKACYEAEGKAVIGEPTAMSEIEVSSCLRRGMPVVDCPKQPTPTEPDTNGEMLSLYEGNYITLSELATLAHDAGYISNPDKWEASNYFKLDIPISEKVDNWNTYFEILLTVINIFLMPWNDCDKLPDYDNTDNTPTKALKALFDDTEGEPEEAEDSGEWNRPQPTEDHTSPTEPPTTQPHTEPIEPPETAVQPSETVLEMPLTIYPETEKLDSKLELNFNACFYSFSVANIREIAKMAEFSDTHHGTNTIDIMVANALYYMDNAQKCQDMAKYYFCGSVLSSLRKVSPEIEKRNKVLTAFCKANKATKDHSSTLISDYFPFENVHVIGNRFMIFAISGHVTSVPTSQPEKAANCPRLIDTETTRENKIPLKLPSVSALKKYIESVKLQNKADGGAKFDESKKYVPYDFGEGLPLVNAEYLLICLQVLPDCQMFSTGEFTVLTAIGSDGSKCCMMPIKAREGYKKHKTDLTAFEPKKKTVKATTEKPVESSVNSAVSPTDTAEEAPEPVKVVSAPSDDVQKELENMGIQSVKFFWNGYRINDGNLIKWGLYANAKAPEAIQMTGVYTDLPRALFEVHNDSDPYTDYHCDDTATVTPEHPLFSYVLYAWETSRIRDINSSIKYKNKRISELQKAKGKATAEYIEQYQNEIKELEKELSALQSRRQKKAPQPTTDDLVKVAEMHLAERSARLKEDREKELQEREKALKIKLEGEKLIDSVLQSFPIVEGQPVVTINWSEHPAFYRYEDGELTLSVNAADTLINLLNVRTKSENRYFKLAFSVDCIAENGEKDRYQGYYDLGCNGENGGIIEHIRNYGENILQFHREHPEGCQYAPEVERGNELIQFADWLETFVSAPTENVSGITMTKNPRFQNEDSDEIPQF